MAAAAEREVAGRVEALLARGVARYAEGDLRSAAALWREGVTLAPGDVQLTAYLAWVEARLAIEDPSFQPSGAARVAAPMSEEQAWIEAAEGAAVPEESRSSRPDITLTWYPSVASRDEAEPAPPAAPSPFHGVEEPVRRFLAKAPTRPNLAPLDDAPVLTEERVAQLAGLPASQRPVSTPAAFAGTVDVSGYDDDEPEISLEPAAAEAPLAAEELDAVPRPINDVSTRKVVSPFAERIATAHQALERNDLETAFGIAEEVILSAGDVQSPVLVDHLPALGTIYERVLGDLRRVVRIGSLPPDLDPRSAFLLSRVDGSFPIDDLLDVSGMDRPLAARLVAILLRDGALIAD